MVGQLITTVGQPVTIVGQLVTIVGQPITVVGQPITIMGQPITVVGQPITIVGQPITIVGQPITIVGQPITVVDQYIIPLYPWPSTNFANFVTNLSIRTHFTTWYPRALKTHPSWNKDHFFFDLCHCCCHCSINTQIGNNATDQKRCHFHFCFSL